MGKLSKTDFTKVNDSGLINRISELESNIMHNLENFKSTIYQWNNTTGTVRKIPSYTREVLLNPVNELQAEITEYTTLIAELDERSKKNKKDYSSKEFIIGAGHD